MKAPSTQLVLLGFKKASLASYRDPALMGGLVGAGVGGVTQLVRKMFQSKRDAEENGAPSVMKGMLLGGLGGAGIGAGAHYMNNQGGASPAAAMVGAAPPTLQPMAMPETGSKAPAALNAAISPDSMPGPSLLDIGNTNAQQKADQSAAMTSEQNPFGTDAMTDDLAGQGAQQTKDLQNYAAAGLDQSGKAAPSALSPTVMPDNPFGPSLPALSKQLTERGIAERRAQVGKNFMNTIMSPVRAVQSGVGSVVNDIKQHAGLMQQGAQKGINAVTGVANSAVDWTKGTAQSIGNSISSAVQTGGAALADAKKALSSFTDGALQELSSSAASPEAKNLVDQEIQSRIQLNSATGSMMGGAPRNPFLN